MYRAVAGIESGKLTEAFGSGTAAAISPVGTICYKDKDYETILKIPPRKSSDPTTTATLNQALKDLTEKVTTEYQLPQKHTIKS